MKNEKNEIIDDVLKFKLRNVLYHKLNDIEQISCNRDMFKFAFRDNEVYVLIEFMEYSEVFLYQYKFGSLFLLDRWTF